VRLSLVLIVSLFAFTGLHAVCARLRVPYTGQRFPDAQAGNQDAEKGPRQTGACIQDVQSHQESYTS